MSVEVGSIVEGKVIRIKPFGAIVALDNNVQGLVHISQISSSYVQNISDHIGVGDVVPVKILSVDAETKKIALSIREAAQGDKKRKNVADNRGSNDDERTYHSNSKQQDHSSTLEDKLKDWLKQSNERQAGLNKRNNRR